MRARSGSSVALALVFAAGWACAVDGPGTGSDPYVTDFRYLVEAVESTHPEPYQPFGGRMAFYRTASAYEERVEGVSTRSAFRRVAGEFLATLGDAHTTLEEVTDQRGEGRRQVLPLRLGIATDGLYIQGVTDELAPWMGGRVVAVQGLPVPELLGRVEALSATENVYGSYLTLVRLLTRRSSSDALLELPGGELELTVLTPEGAVDTLEVRYGAEAPPATRPSGLDLGGDNGLLYGRLIGDGRRVGYFAWNSTVSREVVEISDRSSRREAEQVLDWAYNYLPEADRAGDFERDLQRVPALYERFAGLLSRMKESGARHLIIDLRRNSGGMTPLIRPLLYMLYSDAYLTTRVAPEYNVRLSPLYLEKSGYRSIEEYNDAHGTEYRLGEYRFGFMFANDFSIPVEERRGLESITYHGLASQWIEALRGTPLYRPEVVVVTSPRTFSAAYHFMYYLWAVGNATVVGVPPRQAGNAYMETTPFQLPETGLRGSISNAVQIFFPDDSDRGEVFTPDFPVGWEELRRYGFDENAPVRYALDLIEAGRVQ